MNPEDCIEFIVQNTEITRERIDHNIGVLLDTQIRMFVIPRSAVALRGNLYRLTRETYTASLYREIMPYVVDGCYNVELPILTNRQALIALWNNKDYEI